MNNGKTAHDFSRQTLLKIVLSAATFFILVSGKSLGAFDIPILNTEATTTANEAPTANERAASLPQTSSINTQAPHSNASNSSTNSPSRTATAPHKTTSPASTPASGSSGSGGTTTGSGNGGTSGGSTGNGSGGTGGSGSTPPPPPPPTYTYKNGTYYAVGSFSTPGGTEQIGISITVINDAITATSATKMATNPTSKSYENMFIANYSGSVVGQPLATLSLGKVSGASLTPRGFNNALASIRTQAS